MKSLQETVVFYQVPSLLGLGLRHIPLALYLDTLVRTEQVNRIFQYIFHLLLLQQDGQLLLLP